jgi:hypothetical protein
MAKETQLYIYKQIADNFHRLDRDYQFIALKANPIPTEQQHIREYRIQNPE